jgi:hypothetical protein
MTFDNIILTLENVPKLEKYLKDKGYDMAKVKLRVYSTNALECLFSIVRHHNSNPSTLEFQVILDKALLETDTKNSKKRGFHYFKKRKDSHYIHTPTDEAP